MENDGSFNTVHPAWSLGTFERLKEVNPILAPRKLGFLWVIALLALFVSGCAPQIPIITGKAYYVDCEIGSDDNPGTSARQAWGSVERVNQTTFQPGDGIFFKRGATCPGSLTPQGSGVEGNFIVISAYGNGELPIIDGGKNSEAFKLSGQEYWEVSDIEFTGGAMYGVLISGHEDIKILHHIRLTNLMVHDVWGGPFRDKSTGLVVLLANGSQFMDVVINGVTAYNTNQWAGIEVNGGVGWPIDYNNPTLAKDVTVRNSTVYNAYGDGIVLWGVQNGLIEYSVAYDTGQQPAPKTVGTPSSIWTWSCIDCVVQYNESYNAASPEIDGGCYDIDWGTRNNIYQYNYGHDCDGYCLSVFGAEGVTTENAIARYNVCSNNGQRADLASRQGDLFLSTWNFGKLDGVLIYNNTFSWNPERNYPVLVNKSEFAGSRPNLFANNIIVSSQNWLVDGGTGLELDHNLYWSTSAKPPFFSFGADYYFNFDEYQKQSGKDSHSLFTDPKGTFSLPADSPAVDAAFVINQAPATDYFGNLVPYGAAPDIGAHEWTSTKVDAVNPHLLTGIRRNVPTSGAVLAVLIDPSDKASQSQSVFLRSMAHQYADMGLQVLLIDVSGLSKRQRANLSSDWHLGAIPLLGNTLETSTPAVFLFKDGELRSHWNLLALPFELAQAIQGMSP